MTDFLRLIQGYVRLSFATEKKVAVYNALIAEGIASFAYCEDEGGFSFSVLLRDYKRLCLRLEAVGLPPLSVQKRGVASFLKKHTARVGLLFGGLVAVLLYLLSSTVVWDIRVVGNQNISDGEILLSLDGAGLSYGKFFSNADLDTVAIEVLKANQGLSWVSINRKGTVAYIEVLETEGEKNGNLSSEGGANLIAAEDAVIEEIEIVRGKVVARPGMSVKKGALLVSGILEGPKKTVYLQASGRVYGRVTKRFEIEIPYESEKKHYTGENNEDISLNFFGISINICKDTGNLGQSCDTIDKRDRLILPGGIRLPILIDRTVRLGYEMKTETLSQADTVLLATRMLNQHVEERLGDAVILSRALEGEFTENGYRAVLTVTCIMNIAEVRGFSVLEEK